MKNRYKIDDRPVAPVLPLLPEFQPWEDTVEKEIAGGATREAAWAAADAAHPDLVKLAHERGTVTTDPPPIWWRPPGARGRPIGPNGPTKRINLTLPQEVIDRIAAHAEREGLPSVSAAVATWGMSLPQKHEKLPSPEGKGSV